MTHATTRRQSRTCFWVLGLITVLLSGSMADAKSSSAPGGKTGNETLCDYRAHPTITAVTPTQVKPGQRITIRGKNFGSKWCFHSVSFGAKSTDKWTYVSPTTVEATVPSLLPGTVPVTVSTEAGTSQFKLDVQAK